jgi:cytochrome c oxidase cbb3-type subunit 3/ubiquinol-cytochrome c reductase cytochrome c subunit
MKTRWSVLSGPLGWSLAALFAGLVAGCELPGRPKSGDRYLPPQKELAFDALFARNCVGCHGSDGTLGPAPPLNDKMFLAIIPDTELLHVIANGRAGTLMPAFSTTSGGQLTPEQVEVLARGVKARWGSTEPIDAPPYYAKAQGTGDRERMKEGGLKVFARACACCHGDHGEGRPGGDKPTGAINDPAFLALLSDQVLRRYVITGRPDLGMPSHSDRTGRPDGFEALTDDDVTSVVALLSAWRQGRPSERPGD